MRFKANHDAPFSLEAHGHLPGGELHVILHGRLGVSQLPAFHAALDKALAELAPQAMVLDLAGLDYLDTAGAMTLSLLAAEPPAGLAVRLSTDRPNFQAMLELIDPALVNKPAINPNDKSSGFLADLGLATRKVTDDIGQLVAFVGQATKSTLTVLRRPATLRLGDVLYYMQQVGVAGLPIVALIGLLLGMIMAFMSSLQLKSFGADVYVATLVAVAMVRELGPIMTAILVAGRSGSAFAAEIGVMKLRRETDALEAMGLDPIELLVVPRIIALMIALPLLTFFADVIGLAGGAFMSNVLLDITYGQYIDRVASVATPTMFFVGMIKAPVFAFIIAIICTYQGMSASGSAESVGRLTTLAVVQSIFMVILADAAFSIVFAKVGI